MKDKINIDDMFDELEELIDLYFEKEKEDEEEMDKEEINKDGIYYKVAQEYEYLKIQRKKLIQERDKNDAKIEIIEGVLIDLNNILCKHGSHIYEHFVETDPQSEMELKES